jgi:hypothetical protein
MVSFLYKFCIRNYAAKLIIYTVCLFSILIFIEKSLPNSLLFLFTLQLDYLY